MTYEDASVFAQTWGLLYLVVLFAGMLVYALRPGAKKQFDDAAQIPLKED
jgi:cytochrome c oxidase cbb3-type subunit IV